MFSFLLAVLLSMFARLFFLPIRASKWRRETLQISTAGIQAYFIMPLLSANTLPYVSGSTFLHLPRSESRKMDGGQQRHLRKN